MSEDWNELFTYDFADYEIEEVAEETYPGRVLRMREAEGDNVILAHLVENCDLSDKKEEEFYKQVSLLMKCKNKAFLPILGLAHPDPSRGLSMAVITPNMANGSYQKIVQSIGFFKPGSIFNKTKVSCFIFKVAFALLHYHRFHIIHGNLQPQVIWFDEDYEAYIGFAGIKCFRKQPKENESARVTIYTAPEIVLGNTTIPESDLFSFGILFYQLYVNEVQFQKRFDQQTGALVETYRIVIPTNMTPLAKSILSRCVSIKPKMRPNFAEIVALLLKNAEFFFELPDIQEFIDYQNTLITPQPKKNATVTKTTSLPDIRSTYKDREKDRARFKGAKDAVGVLKLRNKGKKFAFLVIQLQTLIGNVNSINFQDTIRLLLDMDIRDKAYEIALNTMIIATARQASFNIYSELLYALTKVEDKRINSIKIKKYMLDLLEESLSHGEPYPRDLPKIAFIHRLLVAEVYAPKEIVKMTKKFYKLYRNVQVKSLCLLFAYFAPYYEAEDPDLYQRIYDLYAELVKRPNAPKAMTRFFKKLSKYSENNWEIFHKLVIDEYDDNSLSRIIRKDDLNALKNKVQKDNKVLMARIDPEIHVFPVFAHDNPPIILYAALFGAFRCFQFLQMKNVPLLCRDDKYRTLSMFAVAGGNIQIVRFAQNTSDTFDASLQVAALYHHNTAFTTIQKWKNAEVDVPDRFGKLILTTAASANNISVTLFCLRAGMPVNTSEPFGWTPLHTAAEQGMIDMCRILLKYADIDPNIKDTWGGTALHLAADRVHPKLIKFFLSKKRINVNAQDSENNTPLHAAVNSGVLNAVKPFMKCPRVDVNLQNIKGLTPLHIAVKNGDVSIIQLLVSHPQINYEIKDNKDRTPIDLAQKSTNPKVKQFFEEYSQDKKNCNVY